MENDTQKNTSEYLKNNVVKNLMDYLIGNGIAIPYQFLVIIFFLHKNMQGTYIINKKLISKLIKNLMR